MSWHFPGVPPEEGKKLAQAMMRPEGTVEFRGSYPTLLDRTAGTTTLLEIVTGQVVFALVRDADLSLRFQHGSPGVGTRGASTDLSPLASEIPCQEFFFALTWSTRELKLYVGRGDGGGLLEAVGKPTSFSLQVAANGTVVRIGDDGVSVAGARIYSGGQQILNPPAMNLWEDTHTAVETLLTGQSDVGYLFENVIANAVLSSLVTGFEGYCQERFTELENEGIPADFGSLVHEFLSREEREKFDRGEELELQRQAAASSMSCQRMLAQRINFQSYDNSKSAFNRGYGIKFGELSAISSQDLQELQMLIRYRHRIIHVSPLLGLLNFSECPPEAPVFSNKATAEAAIARFDTFIRALHEETLELRPPT